MRYQWVMQQGGEDCAAASLSIVLRSYGRALPISRIRDKVGTHQGGTNLLALKQGADALGFTTKAVKAAPSILQRLDDIQLPAILYWKGYHFVVLYGRAKSKFVVSDPALGIRHLDRTELLEGWQGGIMLLLRPGAEGLRRECSEPASKHPFHGLLHRLRQQRAILRKLLPLNLIIGILALATPLLLQYLTDRVLVEHQTEQLALVAIAVIALALVSGSLSWLQSNLVATFAEHLQKALKLDFGQQVLRLPITFHEARRSGTVVRRLADIEQINLIVSQLVIELPIKTFVGAVALAVIFVYSPTLGFATVVIAAIMVLVTCLLRPAIRDASRRAFAVAGENAGVLAEAFNGALTLKSLAAAAPLWSEMKLRLDRESGLNLKSACIRIVNTTLTETVAAIGTILILWIGGHLVFDNQISIGQLIAVYGLKESFLQAVSAVVKLLSDWTHVKAITGLLTELFEERPEPQGLASLQPFELSPQADLQLERLSFRYPGRRPLLQELSVTLAGGRVTALIGESGCGKSTLAKLLAGLYPASSGSILLGKQRLDDVPRDELRHQVVLVPQDTFFLHRSIIENCRLGALAAPFEAIVAACRAAGADEFIRRLPQQYDTVLGVVGANLSGGQRSRLAIARALLKDPPVMILDESTANLDPATEADILDRVLQQRRCRSTILISHRPEVIQRAEQIVLLEDGCLRFSGTREAFHLSQYAA